MSEEQTTPIKFIVRRRFKYGKLWLNPGDPFVPAGGRFDDGILRSNLVKADLGDYRARGRGPWGKRRSSVRIGSKASVSKTEPPVVEQTLESGAQAISKTEGAIEKAKPKKAKPIQKDGE